MSLEKKFKYIYGISGYVIAVALVISIILSVRGMAIYTDTLDANDNAMKLYNSIVQERKMFRVYLEDEQPNAFEQLVNAKKNTQNMLVKIPLNYENMTQEQYICLQSVNNAYASSKELFDKIIHAEPDSKEAKSMIEKYYKVQQYVEEYAKDFESQTVLAGSEYYNSRKIMFYIIPTICIFIACVIIILFMWLKHFINKKVVKPVIKLSDEARKISMNDFSGEDFVADSNDEMAMLINSFTEMKHSTRDYIVTLQEKHQVEKQLEQTRFEMLKNQINPHFLFNTLNLIAGTAQIEDAEVTEKMIVTLSRLFRYNLKTQTSLMPLEQELKIVGDYMYLEQMRFGQRIRYICNADVTCLDELVPSFVLQPLVENAIIHGLSVSEEGGFIYVHCFKKENKMWISVADNGVGMDSDRLDRIRECVDNIFSNVDDNKIDKNKNNTNANTDDRKTVGVGIGNIALRVKGMYNNSGMNIYSTKGKGTVIQIFFE